jgi:hypothetical protein
MMHKKNATVLVPSELLYAFNPDQENSFIAVREHGLIVLRPTTTHTDGQWKVDDLEYRRGYISGLSDGYHKGYSDAMAYEELTKTLAVSNNDEPECTDFCITCPHYDDLFDTCKFYS